ncbi:MAG: hypothetical protein ABI665_27230 [Vicinamibacterales bacterium]
MRRKAEAGHVTGGRVFGYDNVKIAKRDTHDRGGVEPGEGPVTPQSARTPQRVESFHHPRRLGTADLSRRIGVRQATKAYGRELRKVYKDTTREKGQIDTVEATWIRRDAPHLRIVEAGLCARVDTRRVNRRTRYLSSLVSPDKVHGKYLLSGGLLICPTSHGHFEAVKSPWKDGGAYVCATRRRKPGACTNALSLPMIRTDTTILNMIDGDVLDAGFIEELIALVDTGDAENIALLTADRDRLRGEVDRLVASIASGVPPKSVAPLITTKEDEIARLDAQLSTPRTRPNIDRLRAALTQRSEGWRADLRAEPQVARMVLRKLISPLILHDPADTSAFVEWESSLSAGCLKDSYI